MPVNLMAIFKIVTSNRQIPQHFICLSLFLLLFAGAYFIYELSLLSHTLQFVHECEVSQIGFNGELAKFIFLRKNAVSK
jgi:hypothetical protein